MCRSDPQMAVDVTLMMASRWLRITGSGTSRTSMFRMPIQQFAFITTLLVVRASSAASSSSVKGFARGWLRRSRRRATARIRQKHLADFENLLQPPQVIADLLARLLAE